MQSDLDKVANEGTYLERCVTFLFKKKWKLHLYYNGIRIKTIKIDNIDDIKPMSINIWGHKELFGRSQINALIRPSRLLLTDEKKKETHWGVVFEKGVSYNE